MTTPVLSTGTGSANEALMDVNPTIVIGAGGVFQIRNYVVTAEGAVTIRIRETDLNGTELMRFRIAADGLIQGDFPGPSPISFQGGASGRTLAVTQEGSFENSLQLSGD